MNARIKMLLLEATEDTNTDINTLSKEEILNLILTWEGFIGYTDWIKSLIIDIYNVELN